MKRGSFRGSHLRLRQTSDVTMWKPLAASIAKPHLEASMARRHILIRHGDVYACGRRAGGKLGMK